MNELREKLREHNNNMEKAERKGIGGLNGDDLRPSKPEIYNQIDIIPNPKLEEELTKEFINLAGKEKIKRIDDILKFDIAGEEKTRITNFKCRISILRFSMG